jgi:hypothetical protein
MLPNPEGCGTRPVQFLGLRSAAGLRLKLYTIVHGHGPADARLIEAALAAAEHHLRDHPTRHTHYGVGFLGIHDGRGENQVFLDLWINDNELLHTIWTSPKDDPARLTTPGPDHNSVCIWDLAVQAFEREAWVRHALRRPGGPDLDAYLADVMNTAT